MKRDGLGTRARRHGKIIFQLLLIAVINQIDAGINIRHLHPGKGRHAGTPLRAVAAGEVIDFAAQSTVAVNLGMWIGTGQLHLHRARGSGFLQDELCLGRGNKKLRIAALGEKAGGGVGFKIKWQVAERAGGLGRHRCEAEREAGEFCGEIFMGARVHIKIRGCSRLRTGTGRCRHYIYHA